MASDEIDDCDDERDDLDEFIAECAKEDPDFPARVQAAMQERLAAIARGEDPNDVPWHDEEEDDTQEQEQRTGAAPSPAPRPS